VVVDIRCSEVKTKYLYMMGSSANVGKSTLCEGLLSQLLNKGYQAEQLAYIKPMTQCTDKQAVSEFCERKHIAHCSIGSLIFRKGFSKDFIDGLTKNSSLLLQDIMKEIEQLSENKKFVIVDGIGGPATGSVIGISNVDIALLLDAAVVFVGKAGIGSAIDDTILAVGFMQQQGLQNIILIYNKIKPAELIGVKHYLRKRMAELLPDVPILDFIAENTPMDSQSKHQSADKISQWFCAQTYSE
jgi:dethiobiotin synthetase